MIQNAITSHYMTSNEPEKNIYMLNFKCSIGYQQVNVIYHISELYSTLAYYVSM